MNNPKLLNSGSETKCVTSHYILLFIVVITYGGKVYYSWTHRFCTYGCLVTRQLWA